MGFDVELPEDNQDTTRRPMLLMSELMTAHKIKSLHGIILDTDTATDAKPDEIIIGDIATGHNEAFTNVTLPTPAGDKLHEANINVKVNTGAGGNILPLRLFCQMYPEQIEQQGLPMGLTPTPTRLFACNSTRIPQHGALDIWTRWKPHSQSLDACTRDGILQTHKDLQS